MKEGRKAGQEGEKTCTREERGRKGKERRDDKRRWDWKGTTLMNLSSGGDRHLHLENQRFDLLNDTTRDWTKQGEKGRN